jgi:hypothetical protein
MVDWTLDYKEQADSSGDLEYLDPQKLQFAMRGDALRLTIVDDRSYLKVRAIRAFPLTELNEYISLIDAVTGREIGIIRTLRGIDPKAKQLIQEELDRRYFIPKILKINYANKEFGTVYWDVDTDRGNRQFVMRGIRDSMHEIAPGRYLVNDIDGNRFEVPQFDDLDTRSQAHWDKLV